MIISRIGFMGCPEINVPDGRLFPRLVSANDHAMVGEFLSERCLVTQISNLTRKAIKKWTIRVGFAVWEV